MSDRLPLPACPACLCSPECTGGALAPIRQDRQAQVAAKPVRHRRTLAGTLDCQCRREGLKSTQVARALSSARY